MIEDVFVTQYGEVIMTDKKDEIYKVIKKKPIQLNTLLLKPGQKTDLFGYFKCELEYMGYRDKYDKLKELIFYGGTTGRLWGNHWFEVIPILFIEHKRLKSPFSIIWMDGKKITDIPFLKDEKRWKLSGCKNLMSQAEKSWEGRRCGIF